jgi:hypothetical protein
VFLVSKTFTDEEVRKEGVEGECKVGVGRYKVCCLPLFLLLLFLLFLFLLFLLLLRFLTVRFFLLTNVEKLLNAHIIDRFNVSVPDDVPAYLTLQERRGVSAEEVMKGVGETKGGGAWRLKRTYGVEEWGNVGLQA